MNERSITRHVFWTILIVIGQWCGSASASGVPREQLSERYYLTVDQLQRAYRVYLPTRYDGTTPLPLVLVFHGRFQNARDIAEWTDFNAASEEHGFIAVYPIGIKGHWNDGRIAIPIMAAGNHDDVGFVKTLLAHLEATLAIDPTRIYATGMSNGAMFVQRLACELPGIFAAIGPVAGTLPSNVAPQCTPSQPVSVIEIHGTKDAYTHWDGGSVRGLGGKTLSVPKTIAHWRQLDSCPSTPDINYHPHRDQRDQTRVRRETYGPCRSDTEVALYAIEGGGHTWPGGPDDPRIFSGRVNRDISATKLLLAFFEQHPKPTPFPLASASHTATPPPSASSLSQKQLSFAALSQLPTFSPDARGALPLHKPPANDPGVH